MNIEHICETGPAVYSPYPRGLDSLTICKLQRQHFLLSYFKILIVDPARVQPRDLLHDSLMLNQLSNWCNAMHVYFCRYACTLHSYNFKSFPFY